MSRADLKREVIDTSLRLGLTGDETARRLGISKGHWSKVRTGVVKNISNDLALAMERFVDSPGPAQSERRSRRGPAILVLASNRETHVHRVASALEGHVSFGDLCVVEGGASAPRRLRPGDGLLAVVDSDGEELTGGAEQALGPLLRAHDRGLATALVVSDGQLAELASGKLGKRGASWIEENEGSVITYAFGLGLTEAAILDEVLPWCERLIERAD